MNNLIRDSQEKKKYIYLEGFSVTINTAETEAFAAMPPNLGVQLVGLYRLQYN